MEDIVSLIRTYTVLYIWSLNKTLHLQSKVNLSLPVSFTLLYSFYSVADVVIGYIIMGPEQ